MIFEQSLTLVDADQRRRASISHDLSNIGVYVELFENVKEMTISWPRHAFVLIYDDATSLSELLYEMEYHGRWHEIICFSEDPSAAQIVRAVRCGAADFIVHPFTADAVLSSITHIEASNQSGPGHLREVAAKARGRLRKLTPREREVLEGISLGLTNRKIAEKLHISARTVEIHRYNMLDKLGVKHSSAAIRIAIEAELLG